MKDLLTEIKNSLYEELGISKEVTRVSIYIMLLMRKTLTKQDNI